MKSRRSMVRGVGKKSNMLQRCALFFLAIGLIFGLIEPGLNTAFALSDNNKQFNTDYKLSPLDSDKQQLAPVLTPQTSEPLETPKVDNPRGFKYEDASLRTPFTSTYVNNDGSKTMKYSSRQLNFQDGNKWQKIDNNLKAVQKKAPQPTPWETITNTQPKAAQPFEFNGKAGASSGVKSASSAAAKGTPRAPVKPSAPPTPRQAQQPVNTHQAYKPPKDLKEDLFLKQVQSYGHHLKGAENIMKDRIRDPMYQDPWKKYHYVQRLSDGRVLNAHWFEHPVHGIQQLKLK